MARAEPGGFGRQLAGTLLLQGSGAASVFAALLLLGAALGPEAQGQFSRAKALVEFGAALAMFGMPQALYFFVRSGRLELGVARRLPWAFAAAALAVGGLLAVRALPAGPAAAWALLALAVAAATLHGPWRALALIAPRTRGFSIATAVPQWVLLAAAALIAAGGGTNEAGTAAAFVLAFAAGAGIALRALPARTPPLRAETATPQGPNAASMPAASTGPAPALPLTELLAYGLAAWLVASLATASVLLAQQAASALGGPAALGLFAFALAASQVPMTPLNYALPLLFRRRMELGRPAGGRAGAQLAAAFCLLAAAVAALGAAWRSDLGLAGYAGLHGLLAWLLVAAGAESIARLLGVDAQAEGRPWRVAAAEAARLAVLGAGWAWGALDDLQALAQGWAVAAGVSAAVLVAASTRRGRPAGAADAQERRG